MGIMASKEVLCMIVWSKGTHEHFIVRIVVIVIIFPVASLPHCLC